MSKAEAVELRGRSMNEMADLLERHARDAVTEGSWSLAAQFFQAAATYRLAAAMRDKEGDRRAD